ncbi:hypothetical protein [Lactobacillus helveticus]|uniref:hypothetical protein n=1 Tax=Lactobacillus helveticus TaxID=1587 RepID=UPI0015624E60|nr:hypothetical protein [Lactobacillus helveticus]NRN84115.1 hypothetical protein [Lactobacillus helveticus]NRN98903.1 hypothetical protein [Lactobacillus helveticus]
MADIKFMDISENDNPATTDSILVGNADNGVKRTTLGKLGDMFAVHGLFHIERVDQIIKSNTRSYPIEAKSVEGYQFAFWLSPTTTNWSGSVAIENSTQSSSNIWIDYPDMYNGSSALDNFVNGQAAVTAFAVYIKNSVA